MSADEYLADYKETNLYDLYQQIFQRFNLPILNEDDASERNTLAEILIALSNLTSKGEELSVPDLGPLIAAELPHILTH
jgi:dephospho-CoA kinase